MRTSSKTSDLCSAMYGLFLLFAVLLSYCADNSVHAQIVASAGETVILPCYINVSRDIPTVEWSKDEPEHERGEERRRLAEDVRRAALGCGKIPMPDSSHEEQPCCRNAGARRAAAEPTLSRFQVPGVGVTLQCEASGRSPQLEITFLDDQEKNISAGNLKRHQDPRGCVTVVRRVTVLTETNRVTCRVHQPPMNEPRDAHVYITDTVKTINSCAKTCSVAVTVAILFLSGLGVAIYSCKKYGNCVGRKIKSAKESREESETNGKKEVHRPTDPSHIVVNIPRQIWKEEEQGFKLQGKETQELKSKQTPVAFFQGLWIERSPPKSSSGFSKPSSRIRHRVSHGSNPNPVASPNNNDPESLNLPQNKDPKPGVPGQTPALVRPIKRNLSSPALGAMSSSSSSASSSKDTHLEYSVVTRNRYGVLSDLSEVSPLLPPGRMHLCTD
ncbi:uncharacterized protein LOC118284567 isoform X2 [Scophthalmus maximus]|uniref:uncharacterized protein LOC118284567 isoform X2 n=1 Tax=Scophthalmus maximus TaxID=52904 RepID=UPI001FA93E8F|nr:uncharacterized protein LOC118284567 isoform X2 [Scophthalmus maximus]